MNWLALQLADAAFPAGGFAHSSGLEAASQLGELGGAREAGRVERDRAREGGVEDFARDVLWQAGFGSLPLVGDAHREPQRVADLEGTCDALLTGVVSNRASRTQGRALASACARSFGDATLIRLHDDVRARRLRGHHAPLFGAIACALDLARLEAQSVWLHLTLRGVLSAAVRLGLAGAHEAQSIQRAAAPLLDQVLAECGGLRSDQVAQTAPRLELVASQHDHLYSRLFQS